MSSRALLTAFKHLIESPTLRVDSSRLLTSNQCRFICGSKIGGDNNKVSSAQGGKSEFTVGEAMNTWTHRFKEQEVPEPEESIRNIIASILNIKKLSNVDASKDKCLTGEEIKKLETFCEKRLKRMPIPYITGESEFHGINLKMRSPVFIPMHETKMLVDLAIEEIRSKKAKRVLELCCGSGAISLALLNKFPDLHITAVDRSPDACALTKENAQRLQLDKRISVHQYEMTGNDKMDFLGGKFDVLVSNAPYNPLAALDELPHEYKIYEDLRALNGGQDGLQVIEYVLNLAPAVLHNNSKLVLEVYPSHPSLLKELLSGKTYPNLTYLRSHKDDCGIERYVEIIKND